MSPRIFTKLRGGIENSLLRFSLRAQRGTFSVNAYYRVMIRSAFPDDICRLREDGLNYQGVISKASSGKPCRSWFDSADSANQFPFMRSHYFSEDGEHTYSRCRNPHASQSLPWCFTEEGPPVVSELCDIPSCRELLGCMWLFCVPFCLH